ncbi:thiamine phosphate synthase [Marinibacterium sp. SX1]|uniref:thiamine phosphate synthase n=1 Tax=Marinibacterium sp. SX1 TaxID=3388424 RepID=UPI003D16D963
MTDLPQTYLITPATLDPAGFPDDLARLLDASPVACVRLALATRDEDEIARAADALRPVCHERDVCLVVTDHLLLAQRLGLDGVHLSAGTRGVRDARKALGIEGIVGSFCGSSQHDGMVAGEAGADYISFGPVGGGALGDGTLAERDLFEWWSQMIELPVVAEGGLGAAEVRLLTPFTDFFAFGDELWSSDDPVAALRTLRAAMADG